MICAVIWTFLTSPCRVRCMVSKSALPFRITPAMRAFVSSVVSAASKSNMLRFPNSSREYPSCRWAAVLNSIKRAVPGSMIRMPSGDSSNNMRLRIVSSSSAFSACRLSVMSRTTHINPPLSSAVSDTSWGKVLPSFFLPVASPRQRPFCINSGMMSSLNLCNSFSS